MPGVSERTVACPRSAGCRSTSRRSGRAALLAAATLLAGCGPSRPPALLEDPWPLTVPDPAVLGYAVARVPAEQLRRELQAAVGFCPDGLQDGAPLIGVHLDSGTFGGPVGFILPVEDEQAFRDSLDRASVLQSLGGGSYRLMLPPDSQLAELMSFVRALRAGSPLEMLAAMREPAADVMPIQVDVIDGHGLLVPSFEAVPVCLNLAAATGAFAASPPHDLVVSLDLRRLARVHAEALKQAEDRLRALATGAGVGGIFGAIAAARHGADARGPSFNWEVLWAVKSMLDLDAVDAVQCQLDFDGAAAAGTGLWGGADPADPPPANRPGDRDSGDSDPGDNDPGDSDSGDSDPGDRTQRPEPRDALAALWRAVPQAALRARLGEASTLMPVVQTLAPAPLVGDVALVLAADAPAFARAFAECFRPVAEVVKGRGPPCDRYLDELATLLGGWGGVLALAVPPDGPPALLVSLAEGPAQGAAPGSAADFQAWLDWLQPLLLTARVEGMGAGLLLESRDDGLTTLHGSEGVVATLGRRGPIGFCVFGDTAVAPAELCDRLQRALVAATGDPGPVLRADAFGAALDLDVDGRDLTLHWAVAPDR